MNCKGFTKIFLSKIFLPKSIMRYYMQLWLAKLCFETEQRIVILKSESKLYRPDSSQLASQWNTHKIAQLLLPHYVSFSRQPTSFIRLTLATYICRIEKAGTDPNSIARYLRSLTIQNHYAPHHSITSQLAIATVVLGGVYCTILNFVRGNLWEFGELEEIHRNFLVQFFLHS